MFVFFSCNSQKKAYKDLGDGLFADIETTQGNIIVKLNYKETPITVANFVTLAEGKNSFVKAEYKGKPFYNGTIFHRVIKDFMIQGGDPTGTGMGDPGYRFEDEFVPTLQHDKKGILSMANAGPGTNGSQFFITQVPTPHLNGGHTVFGETVKGLEVIDEVYSYLVMIVEEVFGVKLKLEAEVNNISADLIELILELRRDARAEKNWALSDKIRDRLLELGIKIKDGKDKTTWTM